MKRKIETMKILQCPNGMGSTHYVAELTRVKSVTRKDSNHLRVEFLGEHVLTTIDFNDFKEERIPMLTGATGVCILTLSEVDAIAVRYKGETKWNRNYLSQIMRRKYV